VPRHAPPPPRHKQVRVTGALQLGKFALSAVQLGLHKVFHLLQSFYARANHPFLAPPHLHCPHYCNSMARRLRNTRGRVNRPPLAAAASWSAASRAVSAWTARAVHSTIKLILLQRYMYTYIHISRIHIHIDRYHALRRSRRGASFPSVRVKGALQLLANRYGQIRFAQVPQLERRAARRFRG